MRILIATDAWKPQTNGVVRTLEVLEKELAAAGHKVRIVGPDLSRKSCFPMPFYSEIVLEFFAAARLRVLVEAFDPEAIHIATEGPLGFAMRRLCLQTGRSFTTAYHTRFPEYAATRAPRFLKRLVEKAGYAVLRRFHAQADKVLVPTRGMQAELSARGFDNLALWPRGVDTSLFRPASEPFVLYKDMERPLLLYVGRIAAEKNIEAFLKLETPGTKILVGDGPDSLRLTRKYPMARFLGRLEPEDLARAYAAADLFVFPSKTDTFGLVLLEACAAGLRVAAYPACGPRDVFGTAEAAAFAVLDEDLGKAVTAALALPDTRLLPRAYAEKYSWAVSAAEFYQNIC